MKVHQLAKTLSVTPETVRFYARKGLLTPKRNPENGYKEFGTKDQQRLRFIVNARQLGFSVADIEQLLDHADRGESPCPTARRIIEQRLVETEQRFREVKALRERLHGAMAEWNRKPDGKPNGDNICHLIEGFTGAENH